MTAASDDIEADVVRIVAAHAVARLEQITVNARLWHDLKLAGEDFGHVIEELHRIHGVTLRRGLEDYCPTEVRLDWAFLWWPFKSPWKRKKAYREVTVAELVAAARSGLPVG
jgi:hypothetical protein